MGEPDETGAGDAGPEETGPVRTCIVTRRQASPDEMIRFALAPDGTVTPDLRRRLPGRGVWVSATAEAVDLAGKRRAFERGFKTKAVVPAGLSALVAGLMERDCLQALSLANKAGLVITGFAKIEAAIGKAAGNSAIAGVLHASDGGADGKRKLSQALRRRFGADAPQEWETFDSGQLDLALGRTNVIHAALLEGPASAALIARCATLRNFRSGAPDAPAADGTGSPAPGATSPGSAQTDEAGATPRTQDE